MRKTATTMDVNTNATSRSTADLVVSPEKQTYDYRPPKKVRRGGLKNAKSTAVAELLRQSGADVLVHPQFETSVRTGFFGQKKIKRVVVKDMSRFGRNYLQVGMYTEMLFPEYGVHFIAVNDGVDSVRGDSEFTAIRNVFKNIGYSGRVFC